MKDGKKRRRTEGNEPVREPREPFDALMRHLERMSDEIDQEFSSAHDAFEQLSPSERTPAVKDQWKAAIMRRFQRGNELALKFLSSPALLDKPPSQSQD